MTVVGGTEAAQTAAWTTYLGSNFTGQPAWCGGLMARFELNGHQQEVDADGATPLLYVLRDDLGLNGAKFGCGLGQCGACTVLLDDRPVFSCITPVAVAQDRRVTTLEGLGTIDNPGPLQRAFIEEQAAQCGFCIPGMIMRAQALLARNRSPSDHDIRAHMKPNLCRCGTHMRIVAAIRRAASAMRSAAATPTERQP
jgi:nicotinate dehydrogenase subunit A